MPLLREYYSVYDMDNSVVYMYQSNKESTMSYSNLVIIIGIISSMLGFFWLNSKKDFKALFYQKLID